jgi:competence protein ComEC
LVSESSFILRPSVNPPGLPTALAAAAALLAFLVRRRAVAFASALLIATAAIGFAVSSLKAALIAHPVLDRPAYGVTVTGFIELREERERSDRIVVNVVDIDGERLDTPLERVRLSVRRGTAPAVGSYVTLKARLNPPLPPLRPGGYDFARDLYFQRIGAIGFVTGAIKVEAPPSQPSFRVRLLSLIDGMRDGIDRHIRAVVPGDAGSIASALITGKRDALSASVNDAMYVSGLAHVLSISGYHMAVVAGVVFFVLRAGLALIPGVALRYPIKKWGAVAALVAATFYLVLSGAEVATQRSFIMIAIVLIGVMVDRAALTLRNLALAALAVMLVAPEAVVHPSFQMSFAATLALVAVYQGGVPWATSGKKASLGAQAASWGIREITTLVLASLIAGLATTPFAAFHFHRLAPYGVLANLLAMPIVSIWVMPAGLLALVAMPFGFDAPLWRLMGGGIEWMNAIALWVASLPGAVGRIPAFGVGALLMASAGLFVVCLLRTRLRFVGVALVLAAIVMAAYTTRPDVMVSANADAVAVRSANGRLSILRNSSDPLAVRDWLSADADVREPKDAGLRDGFLCDQMGCIARLPDGTVVSVARTAQAVMEDCEQASLVITTRQAPPDCRALVVDRQTLRDSGAMTLQRADKGWKIERAVPAGAERPWAHTQHHAGASFITATPSPTDAPPRADDLQPAD